MNKSFKVGKRIIGEGAPAFIIAEMSGNHAGSMDNALKIVRAAARAGADCIKIQTYTADTITIDCDNEYFRIGDGTWKGENLYKLYQKAYTPWEWQPAIYEEARKEGLEFFSTPFDFTSVDFLEDMGVTFYKIASFELVDIPLIKYVAKTGKPIIMSTGMATLEEIEEAVEAVKSCKNDNLALLRCASAYPAVTDEMNLRTMIDMKERFNIPVGLSDHSMGSVGAVTSVALGASIIEKHFCLSREIENPDSSFSMEPSEFEALVKDVRQAELSLGRVSYGPTKQEESNLKFRRSLFAVEDIPEGGIITSGNIRSIRPSDGMAPKYYEELMGKHTNCEIKRGTPLREDMIAE